MKTFTDEELEDAYMTAPNAKTLSAFLEGLKILGIQDTDKYFMGAEHDCIYIYYKDINAPEPNSEVAYKLECLGFHVEKDCWAWYT